MNKFFITLSLILGLPAMVLSSDKPAFPGFLPGYNGSELPIQYLPGTVSSVETVVDATQEAVTNSTDTRSLQDIGLITAGVTATGIGFFFSPKITTAALVGIGLLNTDTVKKYPTQTALALTGAGCVWGFCKAKELLKRYTYATELTQDQTQIEAYQITAFIKQNPLIYTTTTRTNDLQILENELNQWTNANQNHFNQSQTIIIETSLKLKTDFFRKTLDCIQIPLQQVTNINQLNHEIKIKLLTHLTASDTNIDAFLTNSLLANTTAQATISHVGLYNYLTKKTVTQTIKTEPDLNYFKQRIFALLTEYINDKNSDKELEIVVTFTKNDASKKVFHIKPIIIRTFNGKEIFKEQEYDIATDAHHGFFSRSKRYNQTQERVTEKLWNEYCQQALGNH